MRYSEKPGKKKISKIPLATTSFARFRTFFEMLRFFISLEST